MQQSNHSGNDTAAIRGQPVFAARLEPHRSLSRSGFLVLMACVSVVCFTAGIVFWMQGAWPVFGFLGLDVAIIWLAFHFNYRSGRCSEELAIWPHDMVVRQISPAGRIREHRFNPAWTRFAVTRHAEYGITSMELRSRNRELALGSFLNPADRESFASAFAQALARVKAH